MNHNPDHGEEQGSALESFWLERPGARVRYHVAGRGSPLVFVHGLAGNALSWWQQVDAFAATHTCVTYSQRGFHPTETGGPLSQDDVQNLGADLAALIEHLHLGPATVVAQSMGGWAALELATTRPDLLKGLVLSCTSGQIGFDGLMNDPAWPAEAQAAQRAALDRGIHPAFGERGAIAFPGLHQLYQAIDDLTPTEQKQRLVSMLSRPWSPDALDSLAVPMLFIGAAEDIIFPTSVAESLARRYRAALEVAPEGGHAPYIEQPGFFNAALSRFLDVNQL